MAVKCHQQNFPRALSQELPAAELTGVWSAGPTAGHAVPFPSAAPRHKQSPATGFKSQPVSMTWSVFLRCTKCPSPGTGGSRAEDLKSQLPANTYLKGTWPSSWRAAAPPRGALWVCPGVHQGSVSTGSGLSPTPPASPAIDHRAKTATLPSSVPFYWNNSTRSNSRILRLSSSNFPSRKQSAVALNNQLWPEDHSITE